MKVGIIIPAAGSSSRMNGEPKQLLEFKGRSLLRGAAETALAADCRPVLVVLGANAERLRSEIRDLPLTIEINENWAQGMGNSIKAGLSKLTEIETGLDAVIISLCDQPLITKEIYNRLIKVHQETRKPIAASEYKNTVGVPALFARSMFDELLRLKDDAGAKFVIKKNPALVEKINVPEAASDVDSKQDYERLLQNSGV